MMSEHKRLHPISAVASFVKQLKDLIVPFRIFICHKQSGGEEWLLGLYAASIDGFCPCHRSCFRNH